MLYGKITIPLNMRVAKRGDGLRLEATIDVSALSLSTVQGVMDCFERCLQAVNAAEPEMSLAMLKHEIQSEIS
jgi:hypothetical protein